MAQYVSYSDNSSVIPPNKIINDGQKRPALSVLNHNQRLQPKGGKSSQWLKNDDSTDQSKTSSMGFQIFQDVSMEAKDISMAKTPSLPACVTRLITLNDHRDSHKENDSPYWEFPVDPAAEQKKKDELNWTCPYQSDIYQYLTEQELRFRPRPNYMKKQPDITMNMRSVLVDWLIEVGEEYKLLSETVHLAVSYVDRFLSQMSVLRAKLQLVGTACLFIASKYEEIYPPELKDFVYITDDTYTKKQIIRMETLILQILNFDLSSPTSCIFLQLYGTIASMPERDLFLAQYICEISLLEADPFLAFLPSQIAAAGIILANYTLGNTILWPEELGRTTNIEVSQVWSIVEFLYVKYKGINSYPQQAICEKYRSTKYQRVAEIQCPESLTT
ncbi:hypothetical protein JTE90_020096 [Oedothorax gibbosus]|uniref:Cyclin A n=1 Tax=Oedothorax gibbosus TaxID=931172 RepID=A0AAV6VNK2_9ARAC|nr:hypothetical protein JTE90_020096 [Oedothorax gibbosus]